MIISTARLSASHLGKKKHVLMDTHLVLLFCKDKVGHTTEGETQLDDFSLCGIIWYTSEMKHTAGFAGLVLIKFGLKIKFHN